MEATSEKTFDVVKACAAQHEYCKEKGYPYFAPSNGSCYRCRKNIYKPEDRPEKAYVGITIPAHRVGISVEEAGSKHITGCPHCNWSFCD